MKSEDGLVVALVNKKLSRPVTPDSDCATRTGSINHVSRDDVAVRTLWKTCLWKYASAFS
jgi:hypothetical protein